MAFRYIEKFSYTYERIFKEKFKSKSNLFYPLLHLVVELHAIIKENSRF
jgi:hypothetical protein